MRIILQFPEGLKEKAIEEAGKLEAEGHDVFVSSAPCYGACDLCIEEARLVKADKIIHFGHEKFMDAKAGVEVECVPYFLEIDWKKAEGVVKKGAGMLCKEGVGKVALVFPIQHLHNSKRVKEILEKGGIEVHLSKGGCHTQHPGQVLGCDTSAAAVPGCNGVVYFGGGKFHPLAVSSEKPVLCIDPHTMDAYWITDEIKKLEKRKKGAILAASKAKAFGILVSTKCGQDNLSAARMAKKMVEEKGRKAVILVSNEFNPVALANFMSFGAYINTACPRISEDREAFGKPIVNVGDLKRLVDIIGEILV